MPYLDNKNGYKTFRKKSRNHQKLINEALSILDALGIPLDGISKRALEKMALAFIAVCQITKSGDWAKVKDKTDGIDLKSRDIINYINKNFGEKISSGSYDDIRRKDLKMLVLAEVVSKSKPNTATNDPTRGYCLSAEYSPAIRLYGQAGWQRAVEQVLSDKPSLEQQLARERQLVRVKVTLPSYATLDFSPGVHNELQKSIIEEFLPRFGKGAEVLYVGDTDNKSLVLEKKRLAQLQFFEIGPDKLPDVIAYSKEKNWLFLIEAYHSTGTVSPLRHLELETLCKDCTVPVVYVTAFQDKPTFRANAAEISWETEVWIADHPDHMIHFNGDKFLGPY